MKSGATTVLTFRLKRMLIEVFKCVNNLGPKCMDGIFQIKDMPYSFRNSTKLVQPKCSTTNCGLRSFSYIGVKLWNELPDELNTVRHGTLYEFKRCLQNWCGPDDSV